MKIFLFLILFITLTFAHKLNIFLSQENNEVYVSAYFASGAVCKNCEVEVKDEKNKVLIKSKTDEKGEFIIKNLSSKVFVKVEALGGHGASASIDIAKVIKDKKLEETNLDVKFKILKDENQKLKTKIKLLEEKINQNELLKIFFALLVIVGIFFVLKRVKKNA